MGGTEEELIVQAIEQTKKAKTGAAANKKKTTKTSKNKENAAKNKYPPSSTNMDPLFSSSRQLITLEMANDMAAYGDKLAHAAAEAAVDVYQKVTVEEYDETVQKMAHDKFQSPSVLAAQKLAVPAQKWDTQEQALMKKRQVAVARKLKQECLAELMYWNQTLVVEEEHKEQLEEKACRQKKREVAFAEIGASTSLSVSKKTNTNTTVATKKKKKKQALSVPQASGEVSGEVTQPEPPAIVTPTNETVSKKKKKTTISKSKPKAKPETKKKAKLTKAQLVEERNTIRSNRKRCLKELRLTVSPKGLLPYKPPTKRQQKKAAKRLQTFWRRYQEQKKQRYAYMMEQFKLAAGKQSRTLLAERQAQFRKLAAQRRMEEEQQAMDEEELTVSVYENSTRYGEDSIHENSTWYVDGSVAEGGETATRGTEPTEWTGPTQADTILVQDQQRGCEDAEERAGFLVDSCSNGCNTWFDEQVQSWQEYYKNSPQLVFDLGAGNKSPTNILAATFAKMQEATRKEKDVAVVAQTNDPTTFSTKASQL